MNVIGRTNAGGIIMGMSAADLEALRKAVDSCCGMPSGLVLAELSEKQITVLRELAETVKKARK